jgi:hypothetical protein
MVCGSLHATGVASAFGGSPLAPTSDPPASTAPAEGLALAAAGALLAPGAVGAALPAEDGVLVAARGSPGVRGSLDAGVGAPAAANTPAAAPATTSSEVTTATCQPRSGRRGGPAIQAWQAGHFVAPGRIARALQRGHVVFDVARGS